MTKALTKGEKLALKKARRAMMIAEGIARRPSGRKYEPPKSERERDAMATVLSRRCRHAGIADTDENRRKMRSADQGSAIGRLFEAGALRTEAEPQEAAIRRKEAAIAFAILDTRHRQLQGLPPRHARGASYGQVMSGGYPHSEEAIRACRAAHSAAARAMQTLMGVVARNMFVAVAVMDADIPASPNAYAALRRALDVMADHFGR